MQLSDFTPGMRVELSPATDAWMMGDRFGTVEPVKGRKYVTVKMDRSGKVRKLTPDLLTIVRSRTTGNPVMDPMKLRSTRYSAPRTPQTPDEPNSRTKRRVKRSHGVQDISRMMLRS
jgi:hypothetical protein